MINGYINEITLFAKYAFKMYNPKLLIIIIILLILPLVLYKKVKYLFEINFNNAIRFGITYLLSVFQLIIIYNASIIETETIRPVNNNIFVNEIRRNNNPVGAADILRQIAEQVGIDLNNLIDIEIVQIEPQFVNVEQEVNNQNDAQNVHDTSIQSHIVKCIERLKNDPYKNKLSLTNIELVSEIKKYIFNNYDGDDLKKERALNTLNKMKQINGHISKINMTEMDVLRLVWNRINNPINEKQQENMKNNLILELADGMIDEQNAYCIVGRSSRIIQSLECTDTENIINFKPLWIIKEEISNYFSKIRNLLSKKLSKKHKEIYEKFEGISYKEQKIIDKINKIVKNKININLIKKYVDTNILNNKQYNTITKPYFDTFI